MTTALLLPKVQNKRATRVITDLVQLTAPGVRFSLRVPAGYLLEHLFGMEVMDDDGKGNRSWGTAGGTVQLTTHVLKDKSEVAVRRGDEIQDEFKDFNGFHAGYVLGSHNLLSFWLGNIIPVDSAAHSDLLDKLERMPMDRVVKRALKEAVVAGQTTIRGAAASTADTTAVEAPTMTDTTAVEAPASAADTLAPTTTLPEQCYLPAYMNRQHHSPGTTVERYYKVAFSKAFPAGEILHELFNMELLIDDGEGNRGWGIPYDAADIPGWGERYRHTDPDAAPPAWVGQVQLTTHRLHGNENHEVAVLHSDTMMPEFPFGAGRFKSMGSHALVEAWLRYEPEDRRRGPRNILVDSLLSWVTGGAARSQVIPQLRTARALVDVQHGKGSLASIPDLTGASSATIRWAANVPASFMLNLNPNLRPGDDDEHQQRGQWATTPESGHEYPWLDIKTAKVSGVEVAYWQWRVNQEVPGMESRYAAASSYGMLVAAVGSREAAKEIMDAYPVPSVELRETIQLFIDVIPRETDA